MKKEPDLYIESPYERWSKFWFNTFAQYALESTPNYISSVNGRDRKVIMTSDEHPSFMIQFISSKTADFICQNKASRRLSNMLYWKGDCDKDVDKLYSLVLVKFTEKDFPSWQESV